MTKTLLVLLYILHRDQHFQKRKLSKTGCDCQPAPLYLWERVMREVFRFSSVVLFYTLQVCKLLIQMQYDIGIFKIQHPCNTHNGSTSSVPVLWKSTCMQMVFKGLWYYNFLLQDSKRTAPCEAGAQERMLWSQKLHKSTQPWGSQEALLYTQSISYKNFHFFLISSSV